jgi:hypothetical protein
MKYFSIRVVEANNLEEAWAQVEEGNFEEWEEMCDEVYTLEELIKKLTNE